MRAVEERLAELKRRNAATVSSITAAWDTAGLKTEKNYLRGKIREAKAQRRDRKGP